MSHGKVPLLHVIEYWVFVDNICICTGSHNSCQKASIIRKNHFGSFLIILGPTKKCEIFNFYGYGKVLLLHVINYQVFDDIIYALAAITPVRRLQFYIITALGHL